MAINPVGFPTPRPFMTDLDFSPLSGIADTIVDKMRRERSAKTLADIATQQQAQQQQAEDATAAAAAPAAQAPAQPPPQQFGQQAAALLAQTPYGKPAVPYPSQPLPAPPSFAQQAAAQLAAQQQRPGVPAVPLGATPGAAPPAPAPQPDPMAAFRAAAARQVAQQQQPAVPFGAPAAQQPPPAVQQPAVALRQGYAEEPTTGAYTPEGLERAMEVIKQKESSGRYDLVVDTHTGHRVYGAYGVEDVNIGPWTKAALGRSMTPQEFLADPRAQDAVARYQLGKYADRYGGLTPAARAWFAGPGGMNNPRATDRFGTNPISYGADFERKMQAGQLPPAITQGLGPAQLPPQIRNAMAFAGPQASIPQPLPPRPPVAGPAGPPPVPPAPIPAVATNQPPPRALAQYVQQRTGMPTGQLTREQLIELARNPLTAQMAQDYVQNRIQPKMIDMGQDPLTGQKTYGFQVGNTIVPTNVQGGGQTETGGIGGLFDRLTQMRNAGASREQMLEQIPPGFRQDVDALANYKAVPQNLGRSQLRGPLLTLAKIVNPNFDETMIPTALAMRKDFSGEGRNGQAIGSFNTVQHHLDMLSDATEELAKQHGNYPYLNTIRDFAAVQGNRNPELRDALTHFTNALNAAQHEVANAYNSGHLSDRDMAMWDKLTSPTQSPDVIRRNVADFVDLLNGKRDSLNHMHRQVFGEDAPGIDRAANAATTQKVHQRLPGYAPGATAAPGDTERQQLLDAIAAEKARRAGQR